MRKLLVSLLFILASAMVAAEVGVTDNEILLGQSAAMSGPAAELGKGMNRGARAYFDWINQHGGVNGRKIRLVTLDDGYEPDRAETNTRSLIDSHKVFALFGYVGTPTSNASLPLVNQAHIPFVAPFTGADSLRTPFNRNIFNIRASYRDEAERIAKSMSAIGMKTINIFYQDDAYGQTGLKAMQAAAANHGIQIVATATVKRNSTEVGKAVETLVLDHPANAVFMVSAYKSCAAFISAARGHHFMGPFYNVSFVGTEALVKELHQDGNGVMVSQVLPSPYSATLKATMDYQKTMKAAGIDTVDYVSLEGYIGARVLVEGLKRAGHDLTRERLVSALEGLGDYDLGGIRVKFTSSSHNGSQYVDLSILDNEGNIRS